jgi:hypothetical protein
MGEYLQPLIRPFGFLSHIHSPLLFPFPLNIIPKFYFSSPPPAARTQPPSFSPDIHCQPEPEPGQARPKRTHHCLPACLLT